MDFSARPLKSEFLREDRHHLGLKSEFLREGFRPKSLSDPSFFVQVWLELPGAWSHQRVIRRDMYRLVNKRTPYFLPTTITLLTSTTLLPEYLTGLYILAHVPTQRNVGAWEVLQR